MKKMKLAIVGCGDIAKFVILAAKLNRGIHVTACVDINGKRAAAYARWFRIPHFFMDYHTMLDQMEIDAVYLAVPHNLHFPMIMAALERGVHVFCEKPVTTSLDDALDICRSAKEKGCKVGINYQYRYDRGCYALARSCIKGELGEIYYARCNVPWHRTDTYFSKARWHGSLEQSGGGTLITQASHIVDILLWAMGGKPVFAQGLALKKKFTSVEVEDLCLGIIGMENSTLLQVSSSMIAVPEQPLRAEVYGSRGTGLYRAALFPKARFKGARIKKETPPVGGPHALFASVEGFRQWVCGTGTYLMPVEASLPVLAAVHALYRSSDTGKKEPVDMRYQLSGPSRVDT